MKKTLLTLAFSASVSAIAMSASADNHCEVSITEMDWGSSIIVTNVSKFIMEKGYGCDVETVPSATVTAVASLVETGKPDIVTELWMSAAGDLQPLLDSGDVEEMAPVLAQGGVEGWWVPNYVVEANPEAGTIEGILANPDLVGGTFNQCPEGWGCQIANASYIEAFGLEEAGIEIFNHGSGETLAASIKEKYDAEEPWFGYYWAPTSILGKYPMTMVDMGVEASVEVHACASSTDCTDIEKGTYPPSVVKTVVTKDLKERLPAIHELFTKLSFGTEEMNTLLAWQEDNNATPEEAAAHFIVTYPDTWMAWVNDDAKEKLSALLN